jgi:hypothetical protein
MAGRMSFLIVFVSFIYKKLPTCKLQPSCLLASTLCGVQHARKLLLILFLFYQFLCIKAAVYDTCEALFL